MDVNIYIAEYLRSDYIIKNCVLWNLMSNYISLNVNGRIRLNGCVKYLVALHDYITTTLHGRFFRSDDMYITYC